jgi:hypothetical protein
MLTGMEPAAERRGFAGKNLFLVAFFGLELAIAVPGFVYDKHETRGNFSWNMYSVDHQCDAKYALYLADGRGFPVEYQKAFNRADRAHIVFHRDTLPVFHRYMCEELAAEGSFDRIEGQVMCRIDEEAPVALVRRGVDICTAPNWGVE